MYSAACSELFELVGFVGAERGVVAELVLGLPAIGGGPLEVVVVGMRLLEDRGALGLTAMGGGASIHCTCLPHKSKCSLLGIQSLVQQIQRKEK